ncbi:hypothetical protein ONS95_005733 [Cadophora gregata]|uniref:uncharacterized protein n=1 Tax=Cadophora gregata TaxID=51156 RepID=UPI0026DA9C48|nr:uncharacterized protein ONS95_005733 [Cadophora gregata]KAK0103727.1 hypothetical protein ONS95_005733 [Cadophora gregata]
MTASSVSVTHLRQTQTSTHFGKAKVLYRQSAFFSQMVVRLLRKAVCQAFSQFKREDRGRFVVTCWVALSISAVEDWGCPRGCGLCSSFARMEYQHGEADKISVTLMSWHGIGRRGEKKIRTMYKNVFYEFRLNNENLGSWHS